MPLLWNYPLSLTQCGLRPGSAPSVTSRGRNSEMLLKLRQAPTWRLHTKLYKFGWNTFPNSAQMKKSTDLNLDGVVYLWSIISQILDWILWLVFAFTPSKINQQFMKTAIEWVFFFDGGTVSVLTAQLWFVPEYGTYRRITWEWVVHILTPCILVEA